jgi:hypothetical protein
LKNFSRFFCEKLQRSRFNSIFEKNIKVKKIILILLCTVQSFLYAQTQDLFALASGDFIGFNALFDQKENLYGYISLYSYGKSGEKTKKFEYVLLDKNLNAVANKEFEAEDTTISYYAYIDINNKIILLPEAEEPSMWNANRYVGPSLMEINPKTNTISKKIYYEYENGVFTEVTKPKNIVEKYDANRKGKKANGYIYYSDVAEIKEGGYLGLEYHDYSSYVNNNSLIRFDENRKELWRYKYNTSGDKKITEIFSVLDKDENNIYGLLIKKNKKEISFSLIVLDQKTGKVLHNKSVSGVEDETIFSTMSFYANGQQISNSKAYDGKNVRIGYNFVDKKDEGFTRFTLDKKTFETNFQTMRYIPDFNPYLKKISRNGEVESGYYLLTKDFFIFEDGRTGILMEKYKPEGSYTAPKTTDIVFAYTDKDFKIKGIDVFEKEKTRWANNDYLFSQYLNEGKDLVFFYKDYAKNAETREKNWTLFINTIIDGKFKQEKIPITEKDNFEISPYIAKEGYILLREFNAKEKFNKIRLERLNY